MSVDHPDQRKESLVKFNQYMQSMLPEEERLKFQKIGERLYNSFDVHKGQVLAGNDVESIKLEEALAYVVESLKSGLHPKHLTYDEIHLLRSAYKEDWYTKWGWEASDLPEGLVFDINSSTVSDK
jgi:hypothetical protein